MNINGKLGNLPKRGTWRVLATGATVAAAAGAGFVACAGSGAGGEDIILATSADPLQAVYVGFNESDTNTGVNLLKASSQSRKGKSTGALRAFTSGGLPATCGVTFVSHHYAVTAAHCVSGKVLDSTHAIEQYNTTSLDLNAVYASDVIGPYPSSSDPFPNYTKTALTSANGYNVTNYSSCMLKRRCNASYGPTLNCPLTGTDTGGDLALLYCSTRSSTGQNWVPVQSASNAANDAVQVWWFHELVNLAISGDSPYTPYAPYQPYFNWYHYGNLPDASPESQANNWHYYHPGVTLQPLPLVSWHTVNNQPYTVSNPAVDPITPNNPLTQVATNVPACHGTSGSGVMSNASGTSGDLLVGVVSTGPRVYAEQRLCNAMNTLASDNMGIVRADIVYRFTAYSGDGVSNVLNDRW